jgi:threonine dehydrogenase-like Zn-dependent dehydrogenase
VRIATTTICGTDVHILKGEYPVPKGLTIGHEPVGVIEKLGSVVVGYSEGQRVIAGAITPSGHSYASLAGCHSQDGVGTAHGWKPIGGWKFGNTIDGAQAEYVLVPDAMANLAPVPDSLSDEQVLMCAPTSCRPASPVPRRAGSGSVTPWPSSPKARSGSARLPERG